MPTNGMGSLSPVLRAAGPAGSHKIRQSTPMLQEIGPGLHVASS